MRVELVDDDSCKGGEFEVTYTSEVINEEDAIVTGLERDKGTVRIVFVEKQLEKFGSEVRGCRDGGETIDAWFIVDSHADLDFVLPQEFF